MTVTEYIAKLHALKKEHGNVEVVRMPHSVWARWVEQGEDAPLVLTKTDGSKVIAT